MEMRIWTADHQHSEVQFRVKHLMISIVIGQFTKFSLDFISDDQLENIRTILFIADTDSISTNNEKRDDHLKSVDFFDSEKYQTIKFRSKSFARRSDDGLLRGYLTIRDITKPVSVRIEFGGIMIDADGFTKAGFTINGNFNRKDFGLNWNAITEAGGVVVGDEVKIMGEMQVIQEKE